MVVEDVGHRRRQVAVVLLVRLGVGLLEQVELELGAEHRLEARRPRPLDLRREHLARRGDDRRAVLPGDVAEHERRPLEPRDAAQRREVGPQVEVAVAALPARHRVAGLRVHLHVEREQVVAALEPVLDRLVEEEVRLLALAHQPALHVGEGADDRVDRAGLHLGGELLERQHEPSSRTARGAARRPSLRAVSTPPRVSAGSANSPSCRASSAAELLLGAHPHRALEPVCGPRRPTSRRRRARCRRTRASCSSSATRRSSPTTAARP